MATLRRHQTPRNRKGQLRAHAGKRRKRRTLDKFIPEADSDFAFTAAGFVATLRNDPATYCLSQENVAEIAEAVSAFRSLLAKTVHRFRRNSHLVMLKDEARKKAEAVVRQYANIIRANPDVSDTQKKMLRIKVRPKRLGSSKCPQHPPVLKFVGPGDGVEGVHVLRYFESGEGKAIQLSGTYGMNRCARPDGAVRIELYFDLIPPGEPVPQRPDERGWPKYLRSYSRSPMEVEVPIPSEPMTIVYWACWAGSKGDRSRWSKPCVAQLVGMAAGVPALPKGESTQIERQRGQRVETKVVYVTTPIAGELPAAEGMGAEGMGADEVAVKRLPAGVLSADGLSDALFRELSKLLQGDAAGS
jgi:hypothetical protein